VKFRIGIGFDLHRLEPGNVLILGGVSIPHNKSLVGHSDGDVLAHAITDALLGASGLANIGELFPDTDERFRGVTSLYFLKKSAELIRGKGFEIGNIDSNILAERPRLLPYFGQMKEVIASALGVNVDQVHIKAKTMEKVGPIGAEEAIAAEAVSLLYMNS
jgi:2-C-methyl-D-erythritol 2,4-cyclodiphosphate synthase